MCDVLFSHAAAPLLTIRSYRAEDVAEIARAFYASVREVASSRYDAAQVRAWANEVPNIVTTRARLEQPTRTTYVAELDGTIVGFIEIEDDGHLDMLFRTPAGAGLGVAAKLYAAAESRARERGVASIVTEASLLAEPFFAKHGFAVEARDERIMRGVALPRARMVKTLV
jgi:putative acetyltransferase